MNPKNGTRPFPALTPAQRLYLDINGYVIIENVLSDTEVQTLLEVAQTEFPDHYPLVLFM